jgi:zinc ribbon protein
MLVSTVHERSEAAMIFLLFGGGRRVKQLGAGDTRECPRCHNSSRWERLRSYHELTFFFIPILRWGRRELEGCAICGETIEVPRPRRALGWRTTHATA